MVSSLALAATALITPSAASAQTLPDAGQLSSDATTGFQDTLDSLGEQSRDQTWLIRTQLNSQVSAVLPQAQAAEFSRLLDQAIEAAFPGLIAERTAPAPSPAAAPAPQAEPRVDTGSCPATADACVDLDGQRAWLQDNGRITFGPVGALGGRAGSETPRGTFHVTRKVKDEVSREFNNAPMPNAVYFTNNGHAFHAGSLATRSAGCIHLDDAAAAAFFDDLSVGDTVYIY